MNLGEDIKTNNAGIVEGCDTGRLIAKFSHPEEAKSFAEMANRKAPTDSGINALDSICSKYNRGEIDISQLVCTVWNVAKAN